ncbi:MAG: hypothetical protein K9L02_05535 [Acholeplasmataceae bacterium]|nr:hypothetical protein [Acholeplasmataceae bacterium]
MSKKNEVMNLYNKNPENGAYMIEISLEDYSEIFNGWDASIIKKKDIEPELLDYLEQAGYEIPMDQIVEIYFYLPKEINDTDKENISITGVKNNFKAVLFYIERLLRKNYRRIGSYIFIGILFLIGAYVTRFYAGTITLMFSILIEGFFIGGWFLLWEAFSLFFFDSHETKQKRRVYRRYLNTKIFFKDNIEH